MTTNNQFPTVNSPIATPKQNYSQNSPTPTPNTTTTTTTTTTSSNSLILQPIIVVITMILSRG